MGFRQVGFPEAPENTSTCWTSTRTRDEWAQPGEAGAGDGSVADRQSLLTLEEVPPIVGAGDPEPPNMPVHLAKFPVLKAPPDGFSANDVRYKYSSYWHAEVSNRRTAEGSRQLLNFKNGTCVFAKSNQIACCPVACALTQTVPILLPSLCLACAARRSLGALALALAARSSSSRPISSPLPS